METISFTNKTIHHVEIKNLFVRNIRCLERSKKISRKGLQVNIPVSSGREVWACKSNAQSIELNRFQYC